MIGEIRQNQQIYLKKSNFFISTFMYLFVYNLKYIGETSWNLHIRLKEHKRDIRIGNSNNVLLLNTSQHNHNIDFNSAKMLTYIHNKNLRRIFEAAAISFLSSLNTRPGFYNISP